MDLSSTNWTKAQDIKVNECLAKILSSPMFAKAERQQRFLSYIMAETLEGRAEKLKGYNIGVEVFDRESSFDPTIDAIVRVEAARLRSKLREYYDSEGRTDPVRFELPKGHYAIHIEWREVDSTQDISIKATTFPQPIENKPSIAVLPFANMSSDPEKEYFADGFTDCLITEMSRLSGLFVISRQSSFVYKGMVKRAEEIGLELGVRYLLEGSVQHSGEWVRITAQLIDAVSGAHMWAERYDREMKDVFALQDDVTLHIATVLQVKLAENEISRFGHKNAVNIEAHDALLRGLERFWIFTQTSTEEARVHFMNTVKIDPGYASAHAWLARTLVFQWVFFWDPRDEALELAFKHAQEAVDLDPQNSLAHAVLCWVQCWRRQGDASLAAGQRAIELDPNYADAYLFLAWRLVAERRAEEALRYLRMGIQLNPHPSAVYQLALGFCYFVLELYDEAIVAYRRGTEVSDALIGNHIWLCVLYTLTNRNDEARIERDKVLALSGGRTPAARLIWLDKDFYEKVNSMTQLAGLGKFA
jgi:adenylate cyclase